MFEVWTNSGHFSCGVTAPLIQSAENERKQGKIKVKREMERNQKQ